MKTMLAFQLVVLVLGVGQVTSNDCCVGDQFSAGVAFNFIQISNSVGKNYLFQVTGDVMMDYTGHRYAFNWTFYEYSQKISGNTRLIFLYNEDTVYQIFNDSECFKGRIVRPEPFQCIPDEAERDGSVFIGENSVLLDSWKMSIGGYGTLQGDFRLVTTKETCIPVAYSLTAVDETNLGMYGKVVRDALLFNYTKGLGPLPFVVPDICKNVTQKLKDDRVNTFNKWSLFWEGMVFF